MTTTSHTHPAEWDAVTEIVEEMIDAGVHPDNVGRRTVLRLSGARHPEIPVDRLRSAVEDLVGAK